MWEGIFISFFYLIYYKEIILWLIVKIGERNLLLVIVLRFEFIKKGKNWDKVVIYNKRYKGNYI